MADWQTVRFDPAWEEPLDPEIIPLCDALNAAGFVTVSSCWGHGYAWPCVWFEHSSDERIEGLARYIIAGEQGDFRPHFSSIWKEIRLDGYLWMLEVHLNNVYHDTPIEVGQEEARTALLAVTGLVRAWALTQGSSPP